MKHFAIIILIGLAFYKLPAQTMAWTRANSMGKGFNINNWLEAGWMGNSYPQDPRYTRADLATLKSMGMKTVRLPVIFEWITSETYPHGPDLSTPNNQKAYDYVDSVIKWTGELGMNLIIDNHHGKDLTDATYQTRIPIVGGMWGALARRYKNLDPNRVFFELRNEPTNTITNTNLHTFLQAVIDSVRKYDNTHTLLVGANWWNAGWALVQETMLYNDDNLIYTFHNYSPYEYTHQQVSWAGNLAAADWPDVNKGWTADNLKNEFRNVKTWSTQKNVPIFLGEFGVVAPATEASRCRWITTIGEVLNEINIPWAYWDVKYRNESFGIFTGEQVVPGEAIPCFASALGLSTALPVKFNALTAEISNDNVIVHWSTAGENNCSRFDIELSRNGKNFVKAGTVLTKAKDGNSLENLDYNFSLPYKQAIALFSIGLLAMLGIPIIVPGKRKKVIAAISVVLICSILYSSCKKEPTNDTNINTNRKLFVRIAQTDKNGDIYYSKIIGVVEK